MDIKQLKYFTEIVKCNFNLSNASKELHVSQPALSYIIRNFEETEGVYIFERNKGRLVGLTPAGESFYKNAEILLDNYSNLITDLRSESTLLKGTIKIGIPPLIIDIVFYNVISKLITQNPDIDFVIVEKGAYELKKMLLLNELDFAVLLSPTNIDENLVTEYTLSNEYLTLFLDKKHPLALNKYISWDSLNGQFLSIFDESFMIHHKLMKRFDKENVLPKKIVFSKSWYFLLMSTLNSNFITILPSPVKSFSVNTDIVEKKFYDPVFWQMVLCRINKKKYSPVSKYVLNFILDYFE